MFCRLTPRNHRAGCLFPSLSLRSPIFLFTFHLPSLARGTERHMLSPCICNHTHSLCTCLTCVRTWVGTRGYCLQLPADCLPAFQPFLFFQTSPQKQLSSGGWIGRYSLCVRTRLCEYCTHVQRLKRVSVEDTKE